MGLMWPLFPDRSRILLEASLTEARDAAKIVERLEDLGGVVFINEREVEGWQKCGCGSKWKT